MSLVKETLAKAIIGVALLSAFALPAAAQELKIGVVNVPLLMDRAPQTKAAMDALQENKGVLTCNLGTGKGSSVLEVINVFEEVTGIKIPFQLADRRPGDVVEAWANPDFAKKLLKWEAKRELKEMLADAWNWQKKNPLGYKSNED